MYTSIWVPSRQKALCPLSCLVLSLPQSLLQQAFLKCKSLSLQERPTPQGASPLTSGPTLLSLNTVLPFNISYIIA